MTASSATGARRGLAAAALLLCGAAVSPLQTGGASFASRSTARPSAAIGVGVGGGRRYANRPASSSPLFRRHGATAAVRLSSSAISNVDDAATAEDPTSASDAAGADGDDGGPQLGAWIAIGSVTALNGLGPQRVRTMGIDLVAWHKPAEDEGDKKGPVGKILRRLGRKKAPLPTEWSVQSDVCPHRLAPLSQGRVDEATGCIECPYHGWQFDTDGTLTSLPQLEEDRSIEEVRGKGGHALSYPVHLAGDIIFAFLPTSVHGESFPRSLLPEEHYPYLADAAAAGKKYYVRELPYSADFLIENFMDPAHIPFAHHSLQSVRDDGTPIEMESVVSNFTHVEVGFKDVSRGKARDGVVSFQRPSFYHFRLRKSDGSDGFNPALCIFVTPVHDGRARVLFPGFAPPFVPTWLAHAGSNRFLNTDTWLHDAERTFRMTGGGEGKKPNYVYASRSDLGVSLFRRWWNMHGFADSPPDAYGPADPAALGTRALTRREQIDPWESHSKHCSECRAALRVMKRGQIAGIVWAGLSAVFLRRWPVIAAVAIGLGVWVNVFLKKCATVIEGNPYPSGVDDRSPAATAK